MIYAFGELRSMVERPATRHNFTHIISFIHHHQVAGSTSDEVITSQWLPYLSDRLASWPARTRECPRELLELYESNEAIWAPLVRSLNFASESFKKSRHERLRDATHMKQVTALDLSATRQSWDQIEELSKRSPFGQLEAFAIRKNLKKSDYDQLAALFASPLLSQVEALSFARWDNIKSDVYDLLIEHFPLESLRELDLSGSRIISPRRMKDLLQTGKLEALRRLVFATLGHEKFYDGMLSTLAKHDRLPQLEELRINGATSKDLDALTKSKSLTSLRQLKLSSWEYSMMFRFREVWKARHVSALLNATNLPSLTDVRIELFEEDITPALEALASLDSSALTSLDLRLKWTMEGLTTEHERALQSLLTSPLSHQLERLSIELFYPRELSVDLADHALNVTCQALGEANFEHLNALRVLEHRGPHHETALSGVIAPLLSAPFFQGLVELQLLGEGFWDEDLAMLAEKNQGFKGLGFDAPLSSRGLETLQTTGLLEQVEVLRLGEFDTRSWDEPLRDALNREELLALIFAHDALPRLRLILDDYGNGLLDEDHFLRSTDAEHQRQIIVIRDFTFSDESPVWLL